MELLTTVFRQLVSLAVTALPVMGVVLAVRWLLAKLNAEREGDVILTVEPHLTVFAGLGDLQGEALTHHESYPDNRTAFHAACSALKEILATL